MNFFYIIQTIFKILPISIYIGAFIGSLLFKDMRGILFVSGGIINNIFNFILNKFLGETFPLKSEYKFINLCTNIFSKDTIPKPHFSDSDLQSLSYIFAFYILSQMQYSNISFIAILTIIIITLLSILLRSQCSNISQICISLLFGFIIALIYFQLIQNYYKEANGILTQEESLECIEDDN